MQVEEKDLSCPYCGESISMLIDPADSNQEYIEDCQVCCRPIRVAISMVGNDTVVRVFSENE